MTHSGHASKRAGAIPWTRNNLPSGNRDDVALREPDELQCWFSPPDVDPREIMMRQSVARDPARRTSNPEPALSAVVAHLLGSLGDLVGTSLMARAIASFQPLLCCSPAEHRSPGLLKSRPFADRGHALSQLHRPVHTQLKVSSCAALTQSRNNGNNLQLSEKFFRRSEISTSRIQATPSNGARRRTITRPRHFKLAPLG